MKIWQKYFLRQITSTFLFLLCSIFSVYVLVDLSIHGVRFLTKGSKEMIDLLIYYVRNFSMHLELFLPLTFLLSSIKVLHDLNTHQELVALQMAGIHLRRLLVPLFWFASFLTLVCYANSQWFAPDATYAAQEFKASGSKHKKKNRREHLQAISLGDESELVYQKFDAANQRLFDVYWIRSQNEIWHMKTLDLSHSVPVGYFVDLFARDKLLEKKQSYERKSFEEMKIDEDVSPKPFVPFESRSLSTLAREALYASSDKASIQTHLHYKLALPLLSLLSLLAIAPSAMRFSRSRPIFLLVAMSLFGFISVMIAFDSLLILGENQVLPGWAAMWIPIGLIFTLSIRKFAKL